MVAFKSRLVKHPAPEIVMVLLKYEIVAKPEIKLQSLHSDSQTLIIAPSSLVNVFKIKSLY